MFCRNCGKSLAPGQGVCMGCGVPAGVGKHYCPRCGAPTDELSVVCVSCSCPLSGASEDQRKSRLVAGLLGVLLGGLGIHNFYLGITNRGVAQLLLTVVGGPLTCGIAAFGSWVWGLVEGIQILTGSVGCDAQGRPLKE